MQIAVVAALKSAARVTGDKAFTPYDFRNPKPGNQGFSWGQVGMPSYNRQTNGAIPLDEYLNGINHSIANEGFKLDFEAMQTCDRCVLVLPSGRSAHLEAGWFVGEGKPTAVLLEDPCVPELMYKMFDYIAPNLFDLLGWLGVPD